MVRYVKNILSDFRSFCLAISKMIYLEILWRNHRENSKHVFWTHSNGAIDYQWGDRKSAEDRKLKTIDSCWEIWLDSWKKNLSEINYILKRKSIPNHFVIHVFCIFFWWKYLPACILTYSNMYIWWLSISYLSTKAFAELGKKKITQFQGLLSYIYLYLEWDRSFILQVEFTVCSSF